MDFRNAEKNWEEVFSFWDNSIWISSVKLSLLCREYLSSAVNVLTNRLRIFHSTKKNFSQLNYVHSDQKIWRRCRPHDCHSFLGCLRCCWWKRPLKLDISDIHLITFFGVCNFGNTWAIRVIFFCKMFKI